MWSTPPLWRGGGAARAPGGGHGGRGVFINAPWWRVDCGGLRRRLLTLALEYEHSQHHGVGEEALQEIVDDIFEICDALLPQHNAGGNDAPLADLLQSLRLDALCPAAHQCLSTGAASAAPPATDGALGTLAAAASALAVCDAIAAAVADGKRRYIVHHVAVLYSAMTRCRDAAGIVPYIDRIKASFEAIRAEEQARGDLAAPTCQRLVTLVDAVRAELSDPAAFTAALQPAGAFFAG